MGRLKQWLGRSLMNKIGTGLTLLALLMLGAVAGVFYLTFQQSADSTVINIAGRQRALSQRIGNLAALAAEGNWTAGQDLRAAADLFARSLNGLKNGEAELGLPPAPAYIATPLAELEAVWQPREDNVQTVVQGIELAVQIHVLINRIDQQTNALMLLSDNLAETLRQTGTNDPRVSLAWRQEVGVIQMARQALAAVEGGTQERAALTYQTQQFDKTLQNLIQGNPDMGFPPATGEVEQMLTAVHRVWTPLYADYQELAATVGVYRNTVMAARSLAENSDILMNHSDTITQLFEAEGRRKVLLLQAVLVGFTLVFLAIFAGVLYFTRKSLKPLGVMAQAAEQITSTDLAALQTALEAMATGDLTGAVNFDRRTVPTDSRDEIGRLGQIFNQMLQRLQDAGAAFNTTAGSLQTAMSQVYEDALNLAQASNQLTGSAEQAAGATQQVAATMQHLAQGATEQTHAITRASANVEALSTAIDGIARGAAEQASAVNQSVLVTSRISTAIQSVTATAQTGAQEAAAATGTAETGAKTIQATIQGMENIRVRVGVSAEKVQEMGQRSRQIGAILETIQEIASQTNLLALNAAIEAARAGEHGKGFAVVADEVRKLAEKSAAAANEIGELVSAIQTTVGDAVQAMVEGSAEVENGVTKADEAGQALKQILAAVARVRGQMDDIAQSAQTMNSSSGELVQVMETVSVVVEENSASAQEMAADSSEITEMMETMASISQESGAAVEEVSASAEEMHAQVEEVTAAAEMLNKMAASLESVVTRFKLGHAADAPAHHVGVQEVKFNGAGAHPVHHNGSGMAAARYGSKR